MTEKQKSKLNIILESLREDGRWMEPQRGNFGWPQGTNIKRLCNKIRKQLPNSLGQIRLTIGNGSGKEKTFIYFI